MKIIIILFMLLSLKSHSQNNEINHAKIKEDLNEIITDLSQNYVYLEEKSVDLDCIRKYYEEQIPHIKTEAQIVLFFEYLLNEFYDSHLILNTNTNASFRLYSPIYTTIENGKSIITDAWKSQIKNHEPNIIGAEILTINGVDFDQAIEEFPTHCNNKNDETVREWIANKILSGRYNQARLITLKLKDDRIINFDLDKIQLRKESNLLTINKMGNIGVIRINNSLGRDELVTEFDAALDSLFNTKALILDLRNTVDGGDSYEARGIMGRFISESKPYQIHEYYEKSYHNPENNPKIKRRWTEYVSPRKEQYTKPVVVLVGRWTGSMGEGIAIGFEGIERAKVVGTEMERLAGEMSGFSFKHQNFGYRISTAKLFHTKGTPREKYKPKYYVKQTNLSEDETLNKGIQLLKESFSKPDSLLKKELELISTEDQTLRLLLPEVTEKFGRNSNEYKHVWSLIAHQDSICVSKLIKIINTHGWLGKSRVGAKANQAIWLVIQHADLKTQKKYLPLLKASVEQGESEGWHLAFLQDRVLMFNEKEQIYGTQAIWDNDLKKNKIYPIKDVKNVNQRRKQLGLELIEDYAKNNGYIFNQKK